MTLIDPWYPPDTTPEVSTATPRKCRHEWRTTDDGDICTRCWRNRDAVVSRRSRTNRARGNAIEREWCHRLGLRLTGKFGDAADGDNAMFIGQCKSRATGAFPGWMANELDKLANLRTGRVPILGVIEAPGPGKKARRLVVMDEADWRDLHVGGEG
jgi:hypothetical protein